MFRIHELKAWQSADPASSYGIVVDVKGRDWNTDLKSEFEYRENPIVELPAGKESFLGMKRPPNDFNKLPNELSLVCRPGAVGLELAKTFRLALGDGWHVEHVRVRME